MACISGFDMVTILKCYDFQSFTAHFCVSKIGCKLEIKVNARNGRTARSNNRTESIATAELII